MSHFIFSTDTILMLLAGSQASASYSVFPDDIRVLNPFQKRRFVGIPEGLFQYDGK